VVPFLRCGIERAIHITGMGLAGCCLAWQRHFRGQAFTWEDADLPGASSRMAAGLINPVTGQNFSPSWRLAEFLPEACEFYGRVAELLEARLWHPLPVWRLVSEAEWVKVQGKLDAAAPWIERVAEHGLPGWRAVVVLRGGGRVATREFCEGTQRFFETSRREAVAEDVEVLCEGAAGLIAGRLGKHRCAKGEILTVQAPAWPQDRILIGGGGWLVPLGQGTFKAGSTYTWEPLDADPTVEGREKIKGILHLLGGDNFEVIDHQAGIRPIVRKSQPVIGALTDGRVVFNGLGSKGSLYAPGVAGRLNGWLCNGPSIDYCLDVGLFDGGGK
jgi:flavin-dependent dehydrogenase